MRIFKHIKKIEIYKFGIISPVLHGTLQKQNEYFKRLAAGGVAIPPGSDHVYFIKLTTFKSWLHKYRKDGLAGLAEKERCDKGKNRKIDLTDLAQAVDKVRGEWEELNTIKALWRKLIECHYFKTEQLSYESFRKYLLKNPQLFNKEQKPRKKFEKAMLNDLWMVDFKHGKSIRYGNRCRQTFLCAIIDDATRMIVGYEWDIHEDTASFSRALLKAISVYGIPKLLYSDNAKVFKSHHSLRVCADLGISLLNTQAYDPEAKGKIEKFNLTVQQLFYPMVKRFRDIDLDELNRLFTHFIQDIYHQRQHASLNESPMAKFHRLLPMASIQRKTDEQLKNMLLCSFSRKVRNDATVRIDNVFYEVDVKFIGQQADIRFPLDKSNEFYLYDNGKLVRRIFPVNLVENANPPYFEQLYSKINPGGK